MARSKGMPKSTMEVRNRIQLAYVRILVLLLSERP